MKFPALSLQRELRIFEKTGVFCQALNSYENRVYQIGIEAQVPEGAASFVVAKFYRPGRWSDDAIVEEHAFVAELEKSEIPVVPALQLVDGRSLHRFAGFRFAVFQRMFPPPR